MSDETTLLPCPFCGSEARIADRSDCEECSVSDMCDWHDEHGTCSGCEKHDCWCCVVCDMNGGGCGASSGYRDNPDAAIAAWNTRAERTCEPTLNDSKTAVICSWCGAGMPLQGFEEIRTWGGEMQIATFRTYRYCPNCGARTVD